MDYLRTDKFLDIPERALLNSQLTSSIGADGIWDDFCDIVSPDHFSKKLMGSEGENITEQPQNEICRREKVTVRKRDILTSQNAKDIYLCFLAGVDNRPGASVKVSRAYGVSPKTVRDIWNR